MAEFKLEKDWPIVAAAALGILALILFSRGRQETAQPVVVGGGTPGGFEAALAAQTQIAIAQIEAQSGAFQALTGAAVQRESIGAELEAQKALVAGELETQRLQAGVIQQQQTYGFLGSIIGGLFGLFSWETTARAEQYRKAANTRMRLAYGG